jgi:hypothetical protein
MPELAGEADPYKDRATECLLAFWMKLLDPNVMGVRCLSEDLGGSVTAVIHVAIPLGYGRKELSEKLGIKELSQSEESPRVNLSSSAAFDEPHSYIRVMAEEIVQRFCDFIALNTVSPPAVNDHTIQVEKGLFDSLDLEQRVKPKPKPKRPGLDSTRLQSAIIHAMAMRNAALSPDQIEILMDGKTGEHWIRILRVDRGVRTAVKTAIKQAGIKTAPAKAGAGEDDWMVLFPAAEAKKLMVQT